MSQPFSVIVLAAGKGKRMQSDLAKVLHPLLYRPMIHYLLDTVKELKPAEIAMVVSHQKEKVEEACRLYSLSIVDQGEPLGTGHAVKTALPRVKKAKDVLVLCGDSVLIRPETLLKLYEVHKERKSHLTLLSTKLENPTGYGRIIRNASQTFEKIVEEADCDEKQKTVQEINSGIYFFDREMLSVLLDEIKPHNKQSELYLTDTVELARKRSLNVEVMLHSEFEEVLGINDRKALVEVEEKLQERINSHWEKKGVTLINRSQVRIDSLSQFEKDVTIEGPSVIIRSTLGKDTYVESGCRILATQIGSKNKIKQGCYLEEAKIENNVSIGPYAHLRPGAHLKDKVKIGNFVEVKKAVMEEEAKASHLSYIGDAHIGKRVNLGCGFITCNFDGSPEKKKTVIEDDVFVGSDSQTVAPVTIGQGSYIASGSTVTENVPKESLVLTRGKQVTKPGYAKKYVKK